MCVTECPVLRVSWAPARALDYLRQCSGVAWVPAQRSGRMCAIIAQALGRVRFTCLGLFVVVQWCSVSTAALDVL
jgi:hypothetical protein